MSTFTAPGELTAGKPRRARVKPKYKFAMLFAGAVVLAPAIFFGVLLLHHRDAATSTIEAVAIIIGTWMIAMVAIGAYWLRMLLFEKRLLEWGDLAPATILDEEEYATKYGKLSKVRYRFTDTHGMTIQGIAKYVPVEDSSRPGHAELRAQTLRNPTALFDPNDSSKNMLYPPPSVELNSGDSAFN